MTKRAFIIHGWSGYPEEAWFPWLKSELEKEGFEVQVPAMPQPDEPTIEAWVPKVAEVVGEPDEQTYLVGHSVGCQAIMRYLAGLRGKRVGGCVFVAGWFMLDNLETDEKKIAAPWLKTPIDFPGMRQATDSITAIFSDNDPVVPLKQNIELFRKNLGQDITIITEHNKQHLSEDSGVTELPSALEAITGKK